MNERTSARVISISDIERSRRGATYGDMLSVYRLPRGLRFEEVGKDFYFNAYTYLLTLEGEAVLSVNQQEHLLSRGSLLSASPLHQTSYRSVSPDFRFVVMAVTTELIDHLPLVDLRPRVAHSFSSQRQPVSHIGEDDIAVLESCMDDCARQIMRTGHPSHKALVENALCRFFLEYDAIVSSAIQTEAAGGIGRHARELLDMFIDLVSHNFATHHEVAYYSDRLSITPQYLTRIVREHSSNTPSGFIGEMLYAEARNRLASTNMPIQDIALALGFADQSSFGKFFRRCSGLTPSEFKRQSGRK